VNNIIRQLREDLAAARDENAELQKLLDEARQPSGHRHEKVAEWLRNHGYKVEAPDPGIWASGLWRSHEEVAEWLRSRGYKVEAPMAEGKEVER
jgi:predicted transcriptional regulator